MSPYRGRIMPVFGVGKETTSWIFDLPSFLFTFAFVVLGIEARSFLWLVYIIQSVQRGCCVLTLYMH